MGTPLANDFKNSTAKDSALANSTLTSDTFCKRCVPAGSPSRGGDVTVYVLDISQPSLPTPFILFLYLFLSLWPFQLYFIPLILPTTLRFLILFFRSYLCLLILSTLYLFMKVSLSPDIILSGWLGSKHQLTNNSVWQRKGLVRQLHGRLLLS